MTPTQNSPVESIDNQIHNTNGVEYVLVNNLFFYHYNQKEKTWYCLRSGSKVVQDLESIERTNIFLTDKVGLLDGQYKIEGYENKSRLNFHYQCWLVIFEIKQICKKYKTN